MSHYNIKITSLILGIVLLFSVPLLSDTPAPKKNAIPPVNTSSKPNIVILTTGGGIAGSLYSRTDTEFTVGNISGEALLFGLPETKEVAQISTEEISQIGSQDITLNLWKKLAKRVNTLLSRDNVDGIVITHGTDTIEETAYFLNLVVKSTKPVVLVGATRAYNHFSPDGPNNLFEAIVVASNPLSHNKGVLVAMNGRIYSSRDVTKKHTYSTDSIQVHEMGLLGYIYSNAPHYYYNSTRKHTAQSIFSVESIQTFPKVRILYTYAGQSDQTFKQMINNRIDGIIIAGVGNGNMNKKIINLIPKARKKGIVVVRSTRTGNGSIISSTEINDVKLGLLNSNNLNPQKARILLMLSLTKTKDLSTIQEIFNMY